MRISRPPFLAAWLLEHICASQASESLIGDLVEEYGRGRSDAWFWRQALTAIGVSLYREISTHTVLAVKAMATGWAISFLFQFIVWGILSRLHLLLPMYHGLPFYVGKGAPTPLTWLILWTPIWVGSGWYVGRLYRAHLTVIVGIFSVSVLVWNLHRLPIIIQLLFEALGDQRYLPQFAVEVMNVLLPSVCIVFGGCIISRSRHDWLTT